MRVEVRPYDAGWRHSFEAVRADLTSALAGALAGIPVVIEHIGSTSVPELAAKPAIDIDVVVVREHVDDAVAALARRGYRPRGDLGIPERQALLAPDDGVRRNVYVVVHGCLAWRNHLIARTVLRADPDLRREYQRVKRALARCEWESVDDYTRAKSEILERILRAGGLTETELAAIRSANR